MEPNEDKTPHAFILLLFAVGALLLGIFIDAFVIGAAVLVGFNYFGLGELFGLNAFTIAQAFGAAMIIRTIALIASPPQIGD